MKKFYSLPLLGISLSVISLLLVTGCGTKNNTSDLEEDGEYSGPEQRAAWEIERTKDPATGRVPWNKLWEAIEETKMAKEFAATNAIAALTWTERGPDSDVTGPSNGNTRANGGVTAGRIRAVMVDSLDPTKKTVFVGGVDGGLWKTTDITVSPANWILVNDFLSNLAISAICQDPRPGFQNTMYFCTGESYFNSDAVQGVGVFKSIDGGVTWNFLPSTSAYVACTRILCDHLGNIYLATRGNGLLRSSDGGNSWTTITPTGLSNRVCDLEITSTAAQSRLHMVTGIASAQSYRYTDDPATVTSASGWNAPATPFPSFNNRAEIAVSGNTLYALPADNSDQVPTIYKSTDGGNIWTATGGQPTSGWANGQAWYDLSVRINPSNPDNCIVGGIDCFETNNGGTSWSKISAWVGTSGQYVHADQHDIQWWDGGNKLVFACDGGIHYSADGGTTIRDRNIGLRLKQFYSVAVHPTTTNYFIGGTQDNGVHQLTNPGLGASVEVTGGDGAFVAIDQNEPQYQFGSYVFNVYRRSTNGGATWSTPINNQSSGRFINPWDYDNAANIIYACNTAGSYFRWNDPQTGNSTTVVSIGAFAAQNVSAVHVSPYTANRVYFGTGNGRVVRVDDAHGASPVEANITPTGATGYVNCVVTGSSDQHLIACYSNYNIMNVWVSNDGGTTWTGIDGNLPNMPVRWALFHPDDNAKAYIATETGVWETDAINGASTVWNANATFPNVRTDMIKYRSSDRTIAAATHGRGIWTAAVPAPSGFSFGSTTPATATCPAPASMSVTLPTISNGGFLNPISLSSIAPTGVPAGTTLSFGTDPVIPGNSSVVTLNNTNSLSAGTYIVTVTGVASGATNQTANLTFTVNPGSGPSITTHPVSQAICEGQNVTFSVVATGNYQWQVSTNGGGTWTNVSGQTTSSYTITGVTTALNNNQYRCVVSNQCGSTNSNAAILTVNASVVITAQPADLSLCTGSSATFCVTATGTGLTYQWQSNPVGCGGPWTNIAGATSACYNIPTVTAGMNNTFYRCQVTSTCGPTTITSNCAALTVATAVTVTSQPSDLTVCDGANASFTVAGSGTGLIYQWQVNTGSGFANISNGGVYGGATTATLTITGATTAMNGYQYRCELSNGSCPTPGVSNAATLTINALPAITSSPANQTICTGSNTSFSVTATGTGINYQWQVNTGSGFTNISNGGVYSGATTASLTITGATVALTGYQYRCVVTGTCTPAANSASATLTVHAPVTVTTSPVNTEVCSGSNASFTVAGSSVPAIIYQWEVSTNGGSTWTAITGANSATYTISGVITVMNNNQYRCQLSNATCTTPVVSAAAILTVRQLPTVGLTAAPLTSLLPGQTTTLTATPTSSTGGTLTTTWTLNGGPVSVTGNTLAVTVANIGAYQVSIRETWPSSIFCSSLSQIVTIDASASSRLFVYPSPNDGNFTVSYYNNGGSSTQRRIIIYDSKGAAVFDRQFPVVGLYTLIPVNLERANRGIYYVVVGDASGKKLAEGKVHVR